jgi:Mg2+ and Co2+ transporter CorA
MASAQQRQATTRAPDPAASAHRPRRERLNCQSAPTSSQYLRSSTIGASGTAIAARGSRWRRSPGGWRGAAGMTDCTPGVPGPHEYDRVVVEDSRDAQAAAPAARGPRACHVVHDRGSAEMRFSRESTADLLARGGFFWLDLDQPDADDFEILREVFGFHPLAVEDSEHFDQRAKIEDYDDFVFLVVYGASPDDDRLVEVHCFYSERFLVTVHRDDCPAFAEIRRRYQKRDEAIDRPSLLLYRIIDGLVDSFFPILADFDDRIDELEDQIFREASDKQLQEIFAMKRLLVGMR